MSKSRTPPSAKPPAMTAQQVTARDDAALARVEAMDDPDKLRNLMANADRMGVTAVRDAAFRRLATVQVEAEPETLEHDFLRTIFAYEQLLREELGRAKRLTKTRMRMTKSGAVKALEDFAGVTAEYSAFATLTDRGLTDLTGEAVILRHPGDFDEATRDAATERLTGAGVDPATLDS